MGDEGHNRNRAGTSLLPARAAAGARRARAADGRPGARRSRLRRRQRPLLPQPRRCRRPRRSADAAAGVERLLDRDRDGAQRHRVRRSASSGTGDRWFTAPARDDRRPLPAGLRRRGRQPRHRRQRRSPRPSASAASRWPRRRRSCASSAAAPRTPSPPPRRCTRSPGARARPYQIPALGFRGTPLGIDCREVVRTGVAAVRQHRHRAPRARHRPDRRRARQAADGGVRGGGARPGGMIAHRVAAPVLERAPARGVVAGVVRTAAYLELDGFVVRGDRRGVPLMPNGVGARRGRPGASVVGTAAHLTARGLSGARWRVTWPAAAPPVWDPRCRARSTRAGAGPQRAPRRGEAILRGRPPAELRPRRGHRGERRARALLRALATGEPPDATRCSASAPASRRRATTCWRAPRRPSPPSSPGRADRRALARRRRAAGRGRAHDEALGHAARARRARAGDRARPRAAGPRARALGAGAGPARAPRALAPAAAMRRPSARPPY